MIPTILLASFPLLAGPPPLPPVRVVQEAEEAQDSIDYEARLGEAGAYLTVAPGVETIDVSAVPVFEVTGHLYHLYNPRAVADVVRLLRTGHSAATAS